MLPLYLYVDVKRLYHKEHNIIDLAFFSWVIASLSTNRMSESRSSKNQKFATFFRNEFIEHCVHSWCIMTWIFNHQSWAVRKFIITILKHVFRFLQHKCCFLEFKSFSIRAESNKKKRSKSSRKWNTKFVVCFDLAMSVFSKKKNSKAEP